VTDCFSCGQPIVPGLFDQKGLKTLLRDWKLACAELRVARDMKLACELRLDQRVAKLERDIVRWCWSHAFLGGRGLDLPKTSRPLSRRA
jgi:hypothetical protein